MQIANVKQRQILPRVGKIWVSTPQNRTYRTWGEVMCDVHCLKQDLLDSMIFKIGQSFCLKLLFMELPKYLLKLHQTAPTGLG